MIFRGSNNSNRNRSHNEQLDSMEDVRPTYSSPYSGTQPNQLENTFQELFPTNSRSSAVISVSDSSSSNIRKPRFGFLRKRPFKSSSSSNGSARPASASLGTTQAVRSSIGTENSTEILPKSIKTQENLLTNTLTSLPFHILQQISTLVSNNSKQDLLNLGKSCKTFNYYTNLVLYKDLVLIDSNKYYLNSINQQVMNQNASTLLKLDKLNTLINSLSSNPNLIGFIDSVSILVNTANYDNSSTDNTSSHFYLNSFLTSTRSQATSNINPIFKLYNFLIEYKYNNDKIPLKGLKNIKILDIEELTQNQSFLSYNQVYLDSRKLRDSPISLTPMNSNESERSVISNGSTNTNSRTRRLFGGTKNTITRLLYENDEDEFFNYDHNNYYKFVNNTVQQEDELNSIVYDGTLPKGEVFDSSVIELESYQLNNVNEINDLPIYSTREISLYCPSTVRRNGFDSNDGQEIFEPFDNRSILFQNLTSLEFKSTSIFESFFHSLLVSKNKNSFKFLNLEKLSITLINKELKKKSIIKHFIEFINFNNLKSFELKFSNDQLLLNNEQNLREAFEYNANLIDLLDHLISNSLQLTSLSVTQFCSSNPLSSSNMTSFTNIDNTNNNDDSISSNNIILLNMICNSVQFFKNLKFLNIQLNNFPFLPFVRNNFNRESAEEMAFIMDTNPQLLMQRQLNEYGISNHFIENKYNDFKRFNNNFNSLEVLVILDYFYNWKPFIKINDNGELNKSINLNILSYLYDCKCESCCDLRKKFSLVTTSGEEFSWPNNITNTNNSFTAENCKMVYNFLILQLRRRLPIDDVMMNGLDVLDLPFLDSLRNFNCSPFNNEDIKLFLKLILHNLMNDLKFFIKNNERLKILLIGGFVFKITKLERINENISNDIDLSLSEQTSYISLSDDISEQVSSTAVDASARYKIECVYEDFDFYLSI
ncbi:hypothetical protein B5S33_g2098 [[Candida] boidinii]|nr:hypothetical protein B5S33_g2098 [[Candida] boidinii]